MERVEYFRRGDHGDDFADSVGLDSIEIKDGRLESVHLGTTAVGSIHDRPVIYFNGARYEPATDTAGAQ